MPQHIAWTEIENFHNVRRTLAKYPHLTRGNNVVTYMAKVKLHGTNAGVMIDNHGVVTALSRTAVLTETSDNAGFAKWVAANEDKWAQFAPSEGTVVVFGEWAGPSIQKGVALNQLKEKVFAVFAARIVERNDIDFICEPAALADFVKEIPNAHVLPWYNSGEKFDVDWGAPAEELQPVLDRINAHVGAVEACDPWVASKFGVRGVGEGLVFYPVSKGHLHYENFSNLCFKAKGEKHQVVAHTKPVQVDPTVAANATAFAELVVTPARCEQGARAVNDGKLEFNPKLIGAFLAWINHDVEKETQAELEASGVDRKVALKACGDRARAWYVAEMKKL